MKNKKESFSKKFLIIAYQQFNDLKNQWIFNLISWLFINCLRILALISLILLVVFLFRQDYKNFIFFTCIWLVFLLLDRYFSIQRNVLIEIDIGSLLKKLIKKDYDRIPYKIQNELVKDIDDLLQLDINDNEKQIKEDISILLTYLKFIVLYKNYQNKNNIKQLFIFLEKIKRIFINRDYSQISHAINEDFENFKIRKEWKYIKQKYQLKSKDLTGIVKELTKEKKISFSKKFYRLIINILKIFNQYYIGILVILFIIFAYLLITGKIDLQTFSQLNPIK